MQKVLLDRSYVLGFNLAIIVLIIELFIYHHLKYDSDIEYCSQQDA